MAYEIFSSAPRMAICIIYEIQKYKNRDLHVNHLSQSNDRSVSAEPKCLLRLELVNTARSFCVKVSVDETNFSKTHDMRCDFTGGRTLHVVTRRGRSDCKWQYRR